MHAPTAVPFADSSVPFDPAAGSRPVLKLHRGRVQESPGAGPAAQAAASPLHSLDTVLGAMLVTSVAAGWIVVAVATSAPLAMAGAWMARAAEVSGRT